MKVLVVNAGSSSLKYQLFNTESGDVLAKGICERIGIDPGVSSIVSEKTEKRISAILPCPTMRWRPK